MAKRFINICINSCTNTIWTVEVIARMKEFIMAFEILLIVCGSKWILYMINEVVCIDYIKGEMYCIRLVFKLYVMYIIISCVVVFFK